jgi:co-chaperonin GroES (HSP10)
MSVVKGKLIPVRDNVLISDMDFGEQKTKGGIVILSDDGKSEGVKSRWGKVWAIGAEQKEIQGFFKVEDNWKIKLDKG